MKELIYKDIKFHSYKNDVDETLKEIMYTLTKEKAEIRLIFDDLNGNIDFNSSETLTFKGELTTCRKGHSKIFPTQRAGQSDSYALDSVVKVFRKNGKKYELLYTSPRLKEHKFTIEMSKDEQDNTQGSLYLLINNEKRHVRSSIGEDSLKRLENARDFYLGERHRLK